jgi:8-oxo-dGTP diphosphatase
VSKTEVNFCVRCGSALIYSDIFGKKRPACPNCGWVFFEDPKVAVAVLAEVDQKVLLVRRVNDPERGCWSLPAGFVDAFENPEDAAVRECREETGLEVHVSHLIDLYSGREHPRGADILILYQVEITGGELQAGDDADQAGFFSRDQLPPLAFHSTRKILGLD